VTVTVNGVAQGQQAYLNAWIDSNADGAFSSAERIVDGELFYNGSRTLTFDVSDDAAIGTTFARFRLSSQEFVAPTGEVTAGEVEDYQVTIHRSAWQNAAIAEDVNQDGHVSPIDALLVINHLNDNAANLSEPLPVPSTGNEPPPFLDVNGDNRVAPVDALMVINKISQDANAEAEGEFTPEVTAALTRANVGTLTVVHDQADIKATEAVNEQAELEREREMQISEFSLDAADLLEDVLSEIADDVQNSESDDMDDFFANVRFG
jgi:hypothetical protein